MNKHGMGAVALAVGLATAVAVAAQGISQEDYEAGKARISAEYASNKARCWTLERNASYICLVELAGRDNVARAELDAGRTPTRRTRYNVMVARAEAEFAVARERCDQIDRAERPRCGDAAKASEAAALDDARAALKTAAANESALDNAAHGRRTAAKPVPHVPATTRESP